MEHKGYLITLIKILTFVGLFGILVSGCNSGGGSDTQPTKVKDGDTASQTATVSVIAGSSVKLTQYLGSLTYFNGTLNDSKSTGYLDESGYVSISSQENSNRSWKFEINFSVNLDVSNLTWDSGCPNTTWIEPITGKSVEVTSNLDCYNGEDGTHCSSYTGSNKKNQYLSTPKYSDPVFTFVIQQLSDSQYHVSCTYNWNTNNNVPSIPITPVPPVPPITPIRPPFPNTVYFTAGDGVNSLNTICVNNGNSNNCNSENFAAEYDSKKSLLILTYFQESQDKNDSTIASNFLVASHNIIIANEVAGFTPDKIDSPVNPINEVVNGMTPSALFFYIATNFYINGYPILNSGSNNANIYIGEGHQDWRNIWWLGFSDAALIGNFSMKVLTKEGTFYIRANSDNHFLVSSQYVP